MTQYMFLIYADEAGYADVTPEQWGAMAKEHLTFQEKVTAEGAKVLSGEGLAPTAAATTVRSDGAGGFLVTDGPFAETKEALGGYYLLEASDLDQALEFAKLCPAYGGGVEVRPVMNSSGG